MLEISRKDAQTCGLNPRLLGAPEGRWPGWRWRVVLGCGALLSLAGYKQGTGRPARSANQSAPAVADIAPDTGVLYKPAVDLFAEALKHAIWDGGLLTDELRQPLNGLSTVPPDVPTRPRWAASYQEFWKRLNRKDVRLLPERRDTTTAPYWPGDFNNNSNESQLDASYLVMQGARAVLSTALGQLAPAPGPVAHPAAVNALRGERYALEGYTEILLADLYCSGVPLNTFVSDTSLERMARADNNAGIYPAVIAHRRVAYHPSLTTAQVYRAALAKFDTALSLAHDSARILDLARVGKGRAWLALGRYDSAAAAVAQVPKGFVYQLRAAMNLDPDGDELVATVADREGRNGLSYISSEDPRSETAWIISDKLMPRIRMPSKWLRDWKLLDTATKTVAGYQFRSPTLSQTGGDGFSTTSYGPYTLASWEEAVLIQAEAALHTPHLPPANRTWLQLLNELRATAPIPGTTRPDPAKLVPLQDPGTAHARIALLFAERAEWLFLTGHRQGDLRRLVREYHWPQQEVYPTGPYIVPKGVMREVGQYGPDVTIPIPPQERANPYFHGCLNRGA
jgi:hypothetical protein